MIVASLCCLFLFRQILSAGCTQPRFSACLFTTYLYTTLGMVSFQQPEWVGSIFASRAGAFGPTVSRIGDSTQT